MGNREVYVPQHVFHTAAAEDYPGVTAVSAKLIFPNPFTLGDYKRWYRALMPNLANKEDPDNDALLREYRAAMTIAALEEIMPEGDVEPNLHNPDAFNLRNVVIVDGRVPDDLPIPFATWVCDCAEAYFGSYVVLENRQTKIARLTRFRLSSNTIDVAEPMLAGLLPDLQTYTGSVTFAKVMTKTSYSRWQKSLRALPGVEATDIDNTFFMRQYRAALELIESWAVGDIPLKLMKHKDGEEAPLLLASFLVLAAEAYLAKTMTLKKMPALYGVT